MNLIEDFGDSYFEKRIKTQKQRLDMHRLDFNWVQARLREIGHHRAKILDIGCSDGAFLNQFSKDQFELFGIEPNEQEAKKSKKLGIQILDTQSTCLLYTSPSPRDRTRSRMPSSA